MKSLSVEKYRETISGPTTATNITSVLQNLANLATLAKLLIHVPNIILGAVNDDGDVGNAIH